MLVSAAAAESMHREVENPALEMEVLLGYDGMITYGKAIPARVRIRNLGPDFEGVLAMNTYVDQRQYDRYEREIFLPAGSEKEFTLTITVDSRQPVFTAEVTWAGEVVCAVNAEPARVINPSAMMVGVLSTRPRALANLDIDGESDTLMRYEYWQTVPLTPDTFPAEESLLSSFGMLVIDDIDPSSLSQTGQQLLRRWLSSGGILLCGGGAQAARNVAFFADLTGLSAGAVAASEDVLSSLEDWAGLSRSGRQVTVHLAEITGASPLMADGQGRGLIWRTEVGGGRVYTAAFEAGDASLNADPLLHTLWQRILVRLDPGAYSSRMNSSSSDVDSATVYGGYSLRMPVSSPLVLGVAVIGGGAAIILALYFVLKRKDRRSGLWIAVPAVALAAAGCLMIISRSSDLNRPMDVSLTNLVQPAEGSVLRYTGVIAAAPVTGVHRFGVSEGDLSVGNNYDYYYSYYTDDDEDEPPEPVRLRTCYTAGADQAVSVNINMAWDLVSIAWKDAADLGGRAETAVWMEKDGLHGEIVNKTAYSLAEGWVITTYGWMRTPALAPGERFEFVLKRAQMANPQQPVWQEGNLYLSSGNLYSVQQAAMGMENYDYTDDSEEWSLKACLNMMINGISDQVKTLRQRRTGVVVSGQEETVFLYVAEPVGWQLPALTMDGQPIAASRRETLLGVEIPYETIGRTGVVFHAAGMDPVTRVEVRDSGLPGEDMVLTGYSRYYHTLSENPTFRVDILDADRIAIDAVSVTLPEYYVNQAEAWVLNLRFGRWEQFTLNRELTNVGRYVDGKGRMFIQFRPINPDSYSDIPAPALILEGREKRADD